MHTRRYLALECFLIFAAFPAAFAAMKPHSWMYFALWIAALACGRKLAQDGYSLKDDWNLAALARPMFARMLLWFVPLAFALLAFTYFVIPEHLFSLPKNRPNVWVMVMFFYPVLSVVPQELIYRSFFFRRYATLFATERSMVLASALTFGWVHILLLNSVAILFSALGGVLFAATYRKTKSLAACCIEHALYGCLVFTLGLGYYFYHGQAVR